jgi:hypothetical protein
VAAGKKSLGFLNPLIYSAQGQAAFTDITTGSNPGCGTKGFPASDGWDPATGMGRCVCAAMAAALRGVAPPRSCQLPPQSSPPVVPSSPRAAPTMRNCSRSSCRCRECPLQTQWPPPPTRQGKKIETTPQTSEFTRRRL